MRLSANSRSGLSSACWSGLTGISRGQRICWGFIGIRSAGSCRNINWIIGGMGDSDLLGLQGLRPFPLTSVSDLLQTQSGVKSSDDNRLDLADMGRSVLRPYTFCERFLRLQIKKNGVPVW